MTEAIIRGAVEVPYARRTSRTTTELLTQAFQRLVQEQGIAGDEIDGLGVASFTLRPDRCVDLAWKLGLKLSWSMDDSNGGVSGLNLLHHAVAAIRAGQARHIVLLAGDAFHASDFADLQANYNVTTRELMYPLGIANPNSLFALLTQRHMALHGLDRRDYGELVLAQRRHAARNPQAVYREELTMEDYLGAVKVADPLVLFDCVPVVAGANAILLSDASCTRDRAGCVAVKAVGVAHNSDQQEGDGLATGLRHLAPRLYAEAGWGARDIDLACVYDDYPVMSVVQLEDLGLIGDRGPAHFLREVVPAGELAVNTSGGQLSVGQAGCGGGLHGLTEAVLQLGGRCGDRQLAGARRAVVSGYGMVQYRWGMCANATLLEACQ
ncbi:MAG: thiolase family protein [Proteobacteria bacterium]|nr:thiolase family protein [Pseudomonadota bacterium]